MAHDPVCALLSDSDSIHVVPAELTEHTHRPSLWPICGVRRQFEPPDLPLIMDIRLAVPASQRRR